MSFVSSFIYAFCLSIFVPKFYIAGSGQDICELLNTFSDNFASFSKIKKKKTEERNIRIPLPHMLWTFTESA